MDEKYLKVAAFQGHAIEKNPNQALDKTLKIVEEANKNSVDILMYSIPKKHLLENKDKRLMGNRALFEKMVDAYRDRFASY